MMGVCREAEIKGSKGAFDVSHEQAVSLSKDPSRKSSTEHHDCNSEITGADGTPKDYKRS